MAKTGADLLLDALVDWGVEVIFGLPGDGINGIMESLRTRQDKLRFIQVRHEEAAAFMACGYAKFTGRLGVCLATSGPGGIHLLNGLYDAKMDGQPVLAITGHHYHDLIDTHAQQDVDLDRVFSGLRLEESLVLSWDEDATISLDFSGRRPRLRIYAEAEKGHQDRLLPIPPDFCEFLLQTPPQKRTGTVFQLFSYTTGKLLSAPNVSRVVSAIGKKAGVVVNKAEGKFASAHDLRRCFGSRWARRVKPATLQLLMRHRSIETTLKYYVGLDADDVADELWKGYPPIPADQSEQFSRDAKSR